MTSWLSASLIDSLARAWKMAQPYVFGGHGENALGVVLCAAWSLGAMLLLAALRRRFHIPLWLTQHLLRMTTALWLFIAFYWINYGQAAWLASWAVPAWLAVLNFRARGYAFTSVLYDPEQPDRRPLGNGWVVFLVVWLWWKPGYQFIAISGLLAMAWGLGAAAIVGRYYGKNRFRFRGSRGLTFEAVAAMSTVTLVTTFLIVLNFAAIPTWHVPRFFFAAWALLGTLLTTAVATVCFLYTPRPHEQWAVPLGTAVTLYYYAVSGFHL